MLSEENSDLMLWFELHSEVARPKARLRLSAPPLLDARLCSWSSSIFMAPSGSTEGMECSCADSAAGLANSPYSDTSAASAGNSASRV